MIRIDTPEACHFQIVGPDAVKAADALKTALDMMHRGGFDICEVLPWLRRELEDIYSVLIIAKF